MYHHFVPTKLHSKANALITELQSLTEKPIACPYCQHNELYVVNQSSGYYRCQACKRSFNRSLNTPFYGLSHLEWLAIIAECRLYGQSYATISQRLNCTPWVVKHRAQVIDNYMQSQYPDLYQWHCRKVDSTTVDIPKTVQEQANQLKIWVNNVLQTVKATCPHCQSSKTYKVGEARAQFRCKNCWRYFSYLKSTGLEHLGRSENWLPMIDMLVAGTTHHEIGKKLKISLGTVSKAKNRWLKIIQQHHLLVLKEWLTR